ncbi:MAG: InlB B-repeat-containing protein, partial [Candidatus Neoclostridium sp.]
MKKKLTMMLLALVVALGGTSVAVMSGCNPTEEKPGPSQTAEYTVKFTVNGEEVGKQTVKHGETLQDFAVPAKPGYTGVWVDAEGNAIDFGAAITADAEYAAQYTANTDTEYKTEYYFENVDGDYELDAALTKKLTGTTDTAVTAEGVTKEHYELDETAEGTVKEGTIAGDGSLTLKLYYNLERVNVTFIANGEKLDEQEVRYGAKATATDKPVPAKDQTVEKEFVFSFWTATEGSETPINWNEAVTENVTVYAYYTEQTRTYQISGVFGDGATWYLAKDVDGNEEWSRDNRFNNGTLGIKYGEQFAFAVYASDEVDGKPEVTAVAVNDDGTEGAAIELTEADGMYVLTVGGNVKIKTSVKIKEYALIFNASVAKYEAAWVDAVKEEDVILALTDAEGNVTYFENALNKTVVVRAGVYEGKFVIKDENGAYETVATGVEVDVNNATAVDGKYAVEGTFVICQDKFALTPNSDWTVNGGTVTSPTSDRDHQFTATWDTFPVGKQDFVAVASFKLDLTKDNQESDPTYGIFFRGNGGEVFFGLNRNGIRSRAGFGSQHDIASLYPKYGLGKAADAYDKVTEVVVKKGETIYVFITAERTDNAEIAKVDTKLIAVITKDGLTACTGAFYAADGENVAKLFDEGITSAHITCQQSNPCFVAVYGYAFSTDAAAIDSYLGSADLKATVTVDGNVIKNVDLERGGSEGLKENVISVELPEGKVAKTITVNGEKGMFEPTTKGVNIIINAGFTGTYAIDITTEEGAYVKLTGYVKFNGEGLLDAMVTDGSSVTYTDINGKFEMLTLGAESYTLTATAKGFKKVSVTVTDITKEIEINTTELLMNDTVIFDGVEYGAVECNIKPLTEGGRKEVYAQSFDENGNEIYTSVTTSGCRIPLLYQTIASQKFIVKGSIKYNEIKDSYIRIGFIVRNAEGKRGSITFYGEETRNVSHVENGWGQVDGLEKLPMRINSNPQLWLTGKWEIAMEYDNGHVEFYVRNVALFGDRWLHTYSGNIFQNDDSGAATNTLPFEGPVIVGLFETQNQNSSFVMSDFYASTAENFDNQITIAGTDNLEVAKIENGVVTVKAKEGFEITDIKYAGSTLFAKATEENGTYTLALPAMWMVEGNATVEVVTKEASAF